MNLLSKIYKHRRRIPEWLKGIFYYRLADVKPLYPSRVLIAVTYQCNSRCIMCNIWKMKPKNELSLAEWKKALKDDIFKNIEILDLTGGELSLHPQLVELVEIMMKAMPKLKKITMVSHGFNTALTVKKITQILAICKRKNIELLTSISLDGVGDMHEHIRRIPQAFEKTTETIRQLKALKETYPNLTVSVGSLIMRQNLHKTDEMRAWLEENELGYGFQIVGFHDTYVRNLDAEERVDFTKKESKELFAFLEKEGKSRSLADTRAYYWRDLLAMYRDKKRRTTPCPFLKNQFAMDSFGFVYTCFSSKAIGNVKKDGKSVSDIYFDKGNVAYRRKMWNKDCVGCNSGCNVGEAIAKDVVSYSWFLMTGKPWYGLASLFKIS